MKRIVVVFLACNLLAEICIGGLTESLENYFASVSTQENGLLIVLKEKKRPDRVSVHSYGAPAGENDPQMKSNSELGECFIPYGFKWPVRIGQRDFGFRFYPLDLNDDRKGFFIREQALSPRGRSEKTGVLLHVDELLLDGRSYEIIDEKHYVITSERGVRKTNTYAKGTSEQPVSSIKSIKPNNKQPVHKTDVIVIQANNTLTEPVLQTTDESTSNPWKLVFPIMGVLLIGLFAFFKFRRR
ncbi:MAG: hypothetical protein V3V05_04925 [Pontiella sp.]